MSNDQLPLPHPVTSALMGDDFEDLYTADQMREYGRARQQADDELLRQAGFAFRSVWAIGLTGENVHLIEAAMLAIEARLGADK